MVRQLLFFTFVCLLSNNLFSADFSVANGDEEVAVTRKYTIGVAYSQKPERDLAIEVCKELNSIKPRTCDVFYIQNMLKGAEYLTNGEVNVLISQEDYIYNSLNKNRLQKIISLYEKPMYVLFGSNNKINQISDLKGKTILVADDAAALFNARKSLSPIPWSYQDLQKITYVKSVDQALKDLCSRRVYAIVAITSLNDSNVLESMGRCKLSNASSDSVEYVISRQNPYYNSFNQQNSNGDKIDTLSVGVSAFVASDIFAGDVDYFLKALFKVAPDVVQANTGFAFKNAGQMKKDINKSNSDVIKYHKEAIGVLNDSEINK